MCAQMEIKWSIKNLQLSTSNNGGFAIKYENIASVYVSRHNPLLPITTLCVRCVWKELSIQNIFDRDLYLANAESRRVTENQQVSIEPVSMTDWIILVANNSPGNMSNKEIRIFSNNICIPHTYQDRLLFHWSLQILMRNISSPLQIQCQFAQNSIDTMNLLFRHLLCSWTRFSFRKY